MKFFETDGDGRQGLVAEECGDIIPVGGELTQNISYANWPTSEIANTSLGYSGSQCPAQLGVR